MFKYRSKCRWNMLLHVDGEIIEIRPGELFESKSHIDSRYLEVNTKVLKVKKKKDKAKKEIPITIFKDKINGSSSS